MENIKCYEFQHIKFNKGLFDSFVDATYVIHLLDNGRYESVISGLNKYKPTKDTFIVKNKGFKKCKKILPEQASQYDLIDAFLQIMKHAKLYNYDNILILEDDFIFSSTVNDLYTIDNVKQFINDNKHLELVYYLGCLPWVKMNYMNYHHKLILSAGTHACIYSKNVRNNILKLKQSTITDWDVFLNKSNYYRYCYYKPLCYQYFPVTENRSNWPNPLGLRWVVTSFMDSMKLDTQLEPGYSRMYNISSLLCWIICVIVIYAIIKVWKKMARQLTVN